MRGIEEAALSPGMSSAGGLLKLSIAFDSRCWTAPCGGVDTGALRIADSNQIHRGPAGDLDAPNLRPREDCSLLLLLLRLLIATGVTKANWSSSSVDESDSIASSAVWRCPSTMAAARCCTTPSTRRAAGSTMSRRGGCFHDSSLAWRRSADVTRLTASIANESSLSRRSSSLD